MDDEFDDCEWTAEHPHPFSMSGVLSWWNNTLREDPARAQRMFRLCVAEGSIRFPDGLCEYEGQEGFPLDYFYSVLSHLAFLHSTREIPAASKLVKSLREWCTEKVKGVLTPYGGIEVVDNRSDYRDSEDYWDDPFGDPENGDIPF